MRDYIIITICAVASAILALVMGLIWSGDIPVRHLMEVYF